MIKLQCRCGHTLNLPDHLAGQSIRCKRCEKVMTVPRARAPAAPPGGAQAPGAVTGQDPSLLIAGSRPCPGCGQVYPPTVAVCVKCGVNVVSGAMLYVSLEDAGPRPEPHPGERPAAQLPEAEERPVGWLRRLLTRLGLSRP